jgi:excisionase family DNA binding protein
MRALDHQPLTDDERREVKRLDQQLATATSAKLLIGSAEEAIELPGAVFQLLQQIVHQIGEGKMAIIQEIEEILTTQEAADLLHVSRPYLIKLLEEGEISFTKVGLHRRIRFQDLKAYQKKQEEKQEAALEEIARISQELGLYDDDLDTSIINGE